RSERRRSPPEIVDRRDRRPSRTSRASIPAVVVEDLHLATADAQRNARRRGEAIKNGAAAVEGRRGREERRGDAAAGAADGTRASAEEERAPETIISGAGGLVRTTIPGRLRRESRSRVPGNGAMRPHRTIGSPGGTSTSACPPRRCLRPSDPFVFLRKDGVSGAKATGPGTDSLARCQASLILIGPVSMSIVFFSGSIKRRAFS
ncbi:hypothetical protein ACHAWF_007888, partial [Thalassiosira exigua]